MDADCRSILYSVKENNINNPNVKMARLRKS
jgi:hypothetical protein